ncbi:family 10 glycosylhydrolase, partial [Paenibacillus sp. MCAF20]
PLAAQNPIYAGFDVLQAYLDEAKKSCFEVHAWVENFLVGVGDMAGPIRSMKPEWSMISRQGNDYQDVPLYNTQYYFLNPVQPEVRDFVSAIYKELLQSYNVDGLHLDYIRYPDAGDYTNDFGYDPYTRNLFKQKHGVDPLDLHPDDELWSAWVLL